MPDEGPHTTCPPGAPGDPPRRFDPLDESFREDPYSHYRHFRRNDPVHRGAAPIPSRPDCVYLFRYRDVRRVLEDPDFGRGGARDEVPEGPSRSGPTRHLAGIVRRMLLFTDPPAHTRLRALMSEAVDPELLHGIAGEVPGIVDGLLDELEAGDGPDAMADLAVPLPVLVMARLLGLPAGDLPRFKAWSRDIVSFADVRREEGVPERAARATRELADHLGEVLARRREDPGDDLLSQLVTARLDGEGLTDGELLANAVLLVCAGHETTVNLIGNGLHALLRHPEQLRRVRGSGRLDDRAVDELLRFDCPVQMTFRVARSDVEIGGVPVAAGETVAAVLGAANRDPGAFTGPDRLDVRRSSRPHLAFGGGPHHCLGSHLAKLEARIALGRLLRRFPDASLPDGWEPSWSDTVLFRGLRSLPVELR